SPLGSKNAATTDLVVNHDVETGGGHHLPEKPDAEGEDDQKPIFERKTTGIKVRVVSMFLYALDNTIVADVVPVIPQIPSVKLLASTNPTIQSITEALGDSALLPWLSVGFMIGGVTVTLPFGKLFGLYNVKWLYIISLVLFMVGSALCGAAPTMNAMIVGRVIAGIGGNGMYLGVITLLSVNTTPQERPLYLSMVGLVFGSGTCLGPIVGGAFAESSVIWRFAFYINLIIGGIFAPVYIFLLPTFDPQKGMPYSQRTRGFDYLGAVLSVAMLICIIMPINFGGVLYAWKSGAVIALFVIAGLLIISFLVQQTCTLLTTVDDRLFPIHFLKIKEAVLLFILALAANAAGFIAIYYIPLYFQFAKGETPLTAAVKLLPLIVFISVTILVNGALMGKFTYYQPWYVVGSILVLIGGVLLSRSNVDTSEAMIYGIEVLIGIGCGTHIQAGYAIIQVVVEPAMISYAITYMMVAQILGITLGLSLSGAVFVNTALDSLSSLLPLSRAQLQPALLGLSGDFFRRLSLEQQTTVIRVLVDTLGKTFILIYVFAGVNLLLSLFLNVSSSLVID
ncbi:MAG: hypothetical protein LQ337_006846, partial [Flavoplaca oasis]